jgi:hypothetical protein
VRNGGSVTNSSTPSGSGLFGTGPNTIEFGSNGQLIVEQGGQVIANGTNTRAEAVNVHGFGNTIINRGLIQGQSSAAIWFEDQVLVQRIPSTITERYKSSAAAASSAPMVVQASISSIELVDKLSAI